MSAACDSPAIPLAEPLPTVDRISPDEFYRHFVRKNQPVVMRHMMDDWPAMTRWGFEFFRDLNCQAAVHLESGNVMQHSTQFRKESFDQYVQKLIDMPDRSIDPDAVQPSDDPVGYLSVFRIFDAFPQLRADVNFDILNSKKLKHSTAGWLGPAGTVTGYHIDWGDNLLAQIHGRKCLHLVPPSQSSNMYTSRKFDQGTTLSQVDLDRVDVNRFPKFSQVRHHRVILNPGEMIFIPRGWWHHVRSLEKSISVSNITFDIRGVLFDVAPHRFKQKLHNWGVWRCECTCHVLQDGKWLRK